MPQLVPIRATATDRCAPTTLQRISSSGRNVPSIVRNGSLNRVLPGIRPFAPPGSFCRRALVTSLPCRPPNIRLRPSTAAHRELLGSTARSCALGNDRRRWHTSAPPWRRRIATAARRVGFRPHPPRSSSSRTGARVPRLHPRSRCLSLASAGGSPARRGRLKKVKPAALIAAGFTLYAPGRFSAYAIVTATGTPSHRPGRATQYIAVSAAEQG